MHLVSVYGTLKKGHVNHAAMTGSKYIGDEMVFGFKMLDLSLFPGVVRDSDEDNFIFVEVYQVSSDTLSALDTIEGYDPNDVENSFFKRIKIRTQWGKAWMYVYNKNIKDLKEIQNGSW